MRVANVKGTKDIYGTASSLFKEIVDLAYHLSSIYGFETISTPIMEYKDLFINTLGNTSDIISKEVYALHDRNGEEIILRPEFTASIARSFVQHMQSLSLPRKLFSWGPLFRYERPQKGRMRQFHQLNYEAIGIQSTCYDVEIISLAESLLKNLNIQDFTLHINSLGNMHTRNQYIIALKSFLQPLQLDLSEDSQKRLKNNPLRILDSKDSRDIEILCQAPKISDFYDSESKMIFDSILQKLTGLNINFKINHNIVRGLDYYSHTVFEFTHDDLGAQSAILAGGRYHDLIANLGGPKIQSIGFAAGIERLLLLTENTQDNKYDVSVVFLDNITENMEYILTTIATLRNHNILVNCLFDKSFKQQMKSASSNSKVMVLIGPEEINCNSVSIKHLVEHQQDVVLLTDMVSYIIKILNYATK
ncbi:MAG: histidyl-tRNA synthetase [Candidatus Xenolissoclinum pacificiensis L6]|uniref:Histidine--tRNA ligase n=1 Tax=Candidatus Xenolissoclinum pacificiensis L6 TaxID=1401685 RepID=W2UZX4_9RICK|nr:MAG: histidyl-tRNA synthetase [Candidatus Xenolissoclinum pacificiensis L6]